MDPITIAILVGLALVASRDPVFSPRIATPPAPTIPTPTPPVSVFESATADPLGTFQAALSDPFGAFQDLLSLSFPEREPFPAHESHDITAAYLATGLGDDTVLAWGRGIPPPSFDFGSQNSIGGGIWIDAREHAQFKPGISLSHTDANLAARNQAILDRLLILNQVSERDPEEVAASVISGADVKGLPSDISFLPNLPGIPGDSSEWILSA